MKEEFLQIKISLDTLSPVLKTKCVWESDSILSVLSLLTLETEISNYHKMPCLGDISSLTSSWKLPNTPSKSVAKRLQYDFICVGTAISKYTRKHAGTEKQTETTYLFTEGMAPQTLLTTVLPTSQKKVSSDFPNFIIYPIPNQSFSLLCSVSVLNPIMFFYSGGKKT